MRRPRERRPTCDSGATLVEFAIASLLFFTVTFGTMEGARAAYHYSIVASVARDGARFAAVRGASSGRVATVDQIRTYVRSRSLGLQPNVAVSWTPSNEPGGVVEVSVQHTFVSVVPLLPIANLSMSATARGTVLR